MDLLPLGTMGWAALTSALCGHVCSCSVAAPSRCVVPPRRRQPKLLPSTSDSSLSGVSPSGSPRGMRRPGSGPRCLPCVLATCVKSPTLRICAWRSRPRTSALALRPRGPRAVPHCGAAACDPPPPLRAAVARQLLSSSPRPRHAHLAGPRGLLSAAASSGAHHSVYVRADSAPQLHMRPRTFYPGPQHHVLRAVVHICAVSYHNGPSLRFLDGCTTVCTSPRCAICTYLLTGHPPDLAVHVERGCRTCPRPPEQLLSTSWATSGQHPSSLGSPSASTQ